MTIQQIQKRIAERLPEGFVVPAHTEQGHFYQVNDLDHSPELYPSVTAKLQILKDEGLMNWKMNQALEHIENKLSPMLAGDMHPWVNEQEFFQLFKDAKQSPVDIFEDAGDIGSSVHGYREDYFKHYMYTGIKKSSVEFIPPDEYDVRAVSCMRALDRFMLDTQYQPVACELPLYDHDLKLGGTLDDIGLIDGKLVLMDLKTSNQLKDSYWAQVALYRKMFVKLTGLRPSRSFILRLSKKDGTYEIEEIKNITAVTRWAVNVVKASDGLDMVKELRKKERITL